MIPFTHSNADCKLNRPVAWQQFEDAVRWGTSQPDRYLNDPWRYVSIDFLCREAGTIEPTQAQAREHIVAILREEERGMCS